MRILMLNYEFPPLGGGAANACYYLLKEFSKKNIKIDLITSSRKGFKIERFFDNITIYKLDVKKKDIHYWKATEILRWTFKSFRLAKKLNKNKKYDLVHAWFGWPGGIIAYFLKLPYIVSLRGSDVPNYNLRLIFLDNIFFKPISKKIWIRAKQVIANSEGLKRLALNTLKCNINVIYNGIDINEFKPKSKKTEKKIHLISTGRLIKRKGYTNLIKALDERFKLTLIGNGNLIKELKKKSKDKNVEFKGEIKHQEIVKELQNADIFILPSLNEGMSNSILEAMACGLPIIATNVGGSKELINGNGIIVKKGSVSELKKALDYYANNKAMIKKHGYKSRQIAENFSWKSVADDYERVYVESKE